MDDRIPLTLLPHELRRAGGPALSYRAAYNKALDGEIPAERGDNGRWTVAREDVPAIAAALAGGPKPPGAPTSLAA